MSKLIRPTSVQQLYAKIKHVLEESRATAYRAVNSTMVTAYWNIGRVIVEEEQKGKQRAAYGNRLIEQLSIKLTNDFGKGFDARNLWFMKSFYGAFPILNAVRSELSWTHYRLLLKIEESRIRDFYIDECTSNKWSTRQLERQINSFTYERIISSKNKQLAKRTLTQNDRPFGPSDVIKDPYVLEFLNVREKPSLQESKLESLLIAKLQDFLLELGRGFSFVARQKRISAEHEHFYVDLVFYNYTLKCFVLIDLKVGKLTHQDIGQMDFYVRYFEKEEKAPSDNPTIGIILCSEKNEAIVKYSMLQGSRRLFASKYKFCLPTEKELKEELKRERRSVDGGQLFLES